jgi:hypothetical protein
MRGNQKLGRGDLVDERFTIIKPETGIRRITTIKDNDTAKSWAVFKQV